VYLGAFQKLRESYAVDGLVRAEDVAHAWRAHAKLMKLTGTLGPKQVVPERTFTNAFVNRSRARWEA
jgi:NitT/TauT family transport system substrate-binding protein